ncbi:hypothetical protein [Sorangium sp. So ce1024]|uniref:hypothetical protein n=1 Tax=Sorangium sp. So ce1024 TaxID=3133327 RepID=UPI003F10B650
MTELYNAGCAIEGKKVTGTSRDPLLHRGLTKHRGIKCYRYTASFNVSSLVTDVIDGQPVFEPGAAIELNASLKCDKAIIHSLDKKPGNELVHASSTHKASGWRFHDQTGVCIEHPHLDLINGMRKRLMDGRAEQLLPEGNKTGG